MSPIELNDEPLIIAPSIGVDVYSVRIKGNCISAHSALMIVKEQMRLSGIRKRTISEYDYIFTRMLKI